MAYMSQEKKKAIEAVVKAICKRHGVKVSLAVQHHSTLVLTIREGSIDFFAERLPPQRVPEHLAAYVAERFARAAAEGHTEVSRYDWGEQYQGRARAFFEEVFPALNDGNWDKSDIQTDYFNVGWYVDVQIGRWNKPYRLNPAIPRVEAAPPAPTPPAEQLERADRFVWREGDVTFSHEPPAPAPASLEIPPSFPMFGPVGRA